MNNSDRMKAHILGVAMQLANLHGFGKVTRNMIADRAVVAVGTVSYHYGPRGASMRRLEAAMVERAIESENLKVLGQAIAAKHPLALAAPDSLRKRAVLAVAGF